MRVLPVAAFCLVSLGMAATKLTLKIGGKPSGGVETSQRLTADGGRIVELRLSVHTDTKVVNIHTTSIFDAKGEPVRKVQELSSSDHEMRVVIASFDASGVTVVVNNGETRETKHIPALKDVTRAEVTGFWWLRDHPKPGDKVVHQAFNMDSLAWDMTETTFVGDAQITVAGKPWTAHKVKSVVGARETISYLDETGQPLRIEAGPALMERKEN